MFEVGPRPFSDPWVSGTTKGCVRPGGVACRRSTAQTISEAVRSDFHEARSMNSAEIVHGPNLRQAALITVIGYLLGFGVPFVSFYVLPKLFVVSSAAQTSQNILANQGLLVAAIFAMLLNFIGDILAAWGLYVLLRPVNSSMSMLAAWFRVVYATIGITALLNLVTAYGLLTRPDYQTVFSQGQLDAQVQLAVDSFNFQFAFGLTVFGVYLVILGNAKTEAPRFVGIGFGPLWVRSQLHFGPRRILNRTMVTGGLPVVARSGGSRGPIRTPRLPGSIIECLIRHSKSYRSRPAIATFIQVEDNPPRDDSKGQKTGQRCSAPRACSPAHDRPPTRADPSSALGTGQRQTRLLFHDTGVGHELGAIFTPLS